MLDLLIDAINTKTLAMVSAAIAAIATVLTFAMPMMFADSLGKRMKAVAVEREYLRVRRAIDKRLQKRSLLSHLLLRLPELGNVFGVDEGRVVVGPDPDVLLEDVAEEVGELLPLLGGYPVH